MLQYIIFSCSSYPSRDSVSSEPQWCSDHSQPNAQAAMYTTMQITRYVLNSLTLAHAHIHGNSTESTLKTTYINVDYFDESILARPPKLTRLHSDPYDGIGEVLCSWESCSSGVQNTPLTVELHVVLNLHVTQRILSLLPAGMMCFKILDSLYEAVIMRGVARNKTTDRMFNGHVTFTKHTRMITFAHVEFKYWLASYYNYRSNADHANKVILCQLFYSVCCSKIHSISQWQSSQALVNNCQNVSFFIIDWNC